ncbi:MAG: putative rane protein [Pseudomonadota bacterium]
MQTPTITAATGISWIREGFVLFRQQPGELSMLFLLYMLMMFSLSIIPVVGQLLPLLLVPAFSMAFMQACVDIEAGRKVTPRLLLTAFRSPALGTLLQLGALYLTTAIGAVAASSIIDGGIFWKLMSGQLAADDAGVQVSDLPLAILFSALVYLPAAMAFWHAAPLAVWQRMGLLKAVFYSFFAVKRCGKAYIAYALGWVLVGIALPAVISAVLGLLLGKNIVSVMLLMPLSVILTLVMYCSFYPTYTAVFERPEPLRPTSHLA